MSDDVVIKVQNLSKTFKLYNSPKHRLLEALHPFRKKYHHEYHGLKDISFEIKKGESIGILGKNGAGKSTLLKILTGVMTPTSGTVEVRGRIAALLELGAGFNPELSGMDNIFFQGAIMGISKEEMEVKVKEIVEFADIGEFIVQPVKTYSSGMFARLAFSISINVDPDILIVDEALSVGDIQFQQKCFKRIADFIRHQKTVIFVSHDLNSLKEICERGLVFNDGRMVIDECIPIATEVYFNKFLLDLSTGSDVAKTSSLYDENFNDLEVKVSEKLVNHSQWIQITFDFNPKKDIEELGVGIFLTNSKNQNVFGLNNYMYNTCLGKVRSSSSRRVAYRFSIPFIEPADYSLGFSICDGNQLVNKQLVRDNCVEVLRVQSINRSTMKGFYVYNSADQVEIS